MSTHELDPPSSLNRTSPQAINEGPDASGDEITAALGPSRSLFILAGVGVLIAACFWFTFLKLWDVWNTNPNYSHGLIVPWISLLLIVMIWKSRGGMMRQEAEAKAVGIGVAEIILGLCFHLAYWLMNNTVLDVGGLILVLVGTVHVTGGFAAARAYRFPLLFLIFMAPWPVAWYQPVAIAMQQIVSVISTWMLEMMMVPAFRQGYFIELPGYTMEVGQACSGLRQLTAILAMSVLMGYLSGRGLRFRWALGLLSIPIAIGANCVRVVLTGGILMVFGPRWAEGVYHTLEGMAVILIAAVMVLLTASLLMRLETWWDERRARTADADT